MVGINTIYDVKKHHTKDKGDLGVLKAQVELAEQGWLVLQPQSEHAPFDLVIYKDYTFKKVQVKYRSINKLGQLSVHLRTCWTNKNGINIVLQDKSEIDILCIYCPEVNKCCFIPIDEILNNSIVLRVNDPKNNQKKNIKMFSDYYQIRS